MGVLMQFKFREVNYFEKPGEQNTDIVVEAVTKYVERSDVRDVIVASSTGATALKFAKALSDEARIVCVSDGPFRKEMNFEWPIMNPKIKEQLESLGVKVIENASYYQWQKYKQRLIASPK